MLIDQSPNRIMIVEQTDNPSTDYFVLPHARAMGVPITKLTWKDVPKAEEFDQALVIIVRYLTPAWKRRILQHRQRMAALAYFMDDDIPDIQASRGLPLNYRLKLARYGAWQFEAIMRLGAQLWVSTPYLCSKYARFQPIALTPQQLSQESLRPTTATLPDSTDTSFKVFYHATASHRAEIEWLYPVIAAVLETYPQVTFEIIGDHQTQKQYRKLPRTKIVPPMSWSDYQSFSAQPGRHLGLAPFLASPFNAARSYTKLFDIERTGAKGLLAENGPWKDFFSETRFCSRFTLLPMDADLWIETILKACQACHAPSPSPA